MKWYNPVILSFACLAYASLFMNSTLAQGIQFAEYFIDNDPGIGMATPLSPQDGLWGDKDENAVTDIDTSFLSCGTHQLGVRFQSSDGTWSYTRTLWFQVIGAPFLMGAEWFVDEDPGPGQGTPIPLPVDGVWDEMDEEIDINDMNVSQLSLNGPSDPNGHTIFVRFLDSDGNWGKTRQASFQVYPELYLVAAEWTTNPACPVGQGHEMQPADGVWDEPEEDLVTDVNTTQLNINPHSTVYVRVKDNLGRWSTRGGWVLNNEYNWTFDPDLAWDTSSYTALDIQTTHQ